MHHNRGGSVPPYLITHSGPVLVCGSGASLLDDYQKAREIYPEAPVIAAKGAAFHIKAFAIFSLHPKRFPEMVRRQSLIHTDFTTHTSGHIKDRTNIGKPIEFTADYWWEGADTGSSGWGARKLASFMGFSSVILCGIPMNKGGKVDGPSKHFQNDDIIKFYQKQILADTDFHQGVYSLSGWTKEIFGCP